jgi:glycosyltransferase involved in cell wall biosynthesis
MPNAQKPLLLVISQVYVPDPASVGQHMADVAEAMAKRGYDVRVLASRHGYENPREKYKHRECRSNVDVVRLPWSSFGKRSLAHRLIGQAMFLMQVTVHGILAKRLAKIVVSTSPPMAAVAAVVIASVRRVPISYWVMDLNPDQAIALRKVKRNGLLARSMRWLNRRVFAQAAQVIVLDRFMAERVRNQYDVRGQLEILPPWPHDNHLDAPVGANPFQVQYNPDGKFVVMYSGNHSLASPVTTLLAAALQMQDDPRLLFMFIGGGVGKREVDEAIATRRPTNIISLPYQPLEQIRYSLPTADVHAVTLGDDMVGMIHPCKIYGAMAIGKPILFVGPRPSHASELIERYDIGWQVDQGDVSGTIETLRRISSLPAANRAEMGERAQSAIREEYSKSQLCAALADVVEGTAQRPKLCHYMTKEAANRPAENLATTVRETA